MRDRIVFLNQPIEKVELEEEVDVIVSEWMGSFALSEMMLPTLVYARDNFLRKGGKLFPDEIQLYIAGLRQDWDNVYGLDFTSMRQMMADDGLRQSVDPSHIITEKAQLLRLDLINFQASELPHLFGDPMAFEMSGRCEGEISALVGWFDFGFRDSQIVVSTGPWDLSTHWKQSVFHLRSPLQIRAEDDRICGKITFRQDERDLIVCLRNLDVRRPVSGNSPGTGRSVEPHGQESRDYRV